MADEAQKQLRAYVEYFRDLGVHDFYRSGEPGTVAWPEVEEARVEAPVAVAAPVRWSVRLLRLRWWLRSLIEVRICRASW